MTNNAPHFSAGRRWRRFGVVAAIAVLAVGTATVSASATSTLVKPASLIGGGTVHYAVNKPVCAQPADPAAIRCFAMKRVDVAKGTKGAYKYVRPNAIGLGPAGGYTPDDLAAAYAYNPNINASSQLVALIDWHDDPDALSDLNAFDAYYGLTHETGSSFRKVNQKGKTSPLPVTDREGSGEIALDVEAVRGVCHKCRILLVEADEGTDADLATAENLAVKMGATEISNSFGEPEHPVSAAVRAAYNHPGVVITASTGDDGWFGWDLANNPGSSSVSQGAPEFPASDPDVVSVGGTSLALYNNGTREEEDVWNENGPDDQNGLTQDERQGAGGGGCSSLYAAQPWQANYAGYANAGCSGKRLAADISAIADPQTGFDVLDSFSTTPGWQTIGGTSLSAPVTAALFALAGGSHGTAYPASTLYTNARVHSSSLFDVITGGNSYCAGDSTLSCGNSVFATFSGSTHNPNALGVGILDCSFPAAGDVATAPAMSSECNAVAGYDGPSGLGTPNGLGLFAVSSPAVSIARPSSLTLKKSATFSGRAVEPISSAHVTKYAWNWGDHTGSTGVHAKHAYAKAGTYVVTLTVTDSDYQVVIKKTSITLGKKASVHYKGAAKLKAKHKASFSTKGTTDPNTGGKIAKVSWNWGDHKKSTGTSVKHAYAKKGHYTITIKITDNTGVTTTIRKKVTVKK